MIASALGLGIAGWLEEGRELNEQANACAEAGDPHGELALRLWATDVFNEGADVANRQAAIVMFLTGLILTLALVSVVV